MATPSNKKYLILVNGILFLFAIVLLILTKWNPSDNETTRDILLNLGTELLAVSIIFFLITRNFLEETMNLSEKFKALENKISHTITADEYLNFNEDINANLFQNAHQIDLLGYCLERSLRSYSQILEDRLSDGINIRIILLDYKNKHLMDMAGKESQSKTADEWKNDITKSISHLKEIASKENLKGSLHLGLLPYSPSFGITMLNQNELDGLIYVDIYHHKSNGTNATLKLSKQNDNKWFSFFSEQFDLLWDSCSSTKLL